MPIDINCRPKILLRIAMLNEYWQYNYDQKDKWILHFKSFMMKIKL